MPRSAERVRWVGLTVVEPGRFHIDRRGDFPQQLVLIAEEVDERYRRIVLSDRRWRRWLVRTPSDSDPSGAYDPVALGSAM
jgi:hypothetical protein